MSTRFLEQYSDVVIRHRRLVLALLALAVLFFASQIPKTKAAFSPQDLHTTFEDQKAALDEFAEVFGATESVLLVLVQADDVLRGDVLQYIHTVSLYLAEQDFTERVESLTVRSFTRNEDGTLNVSPIVVGETVEVEEVNGIVTAIHDTPLVQGRLISHDGGLTVVAAFLEDGFSKVEQARPVVNAVDDFLGDLESPDGVQITLGGLPHIRVWVAQRFKEDQVFLVPLALLVCLLIVWVSFRWLPGVVFPGLAVLMSSVLIVGAMALYGEPINIINQVVPLLIIVIGISDSIHLVSRFREEIGNGAEPKQASRTTLSRMAVACFLTSLTTAVGFASLGVSRTELVRRFGFTAAIGVVFAYIVTIHLLPAALSWTKPKLEPRSEGASHGVLENVLAGVIRMTLRHPWSTLVGSFVVFCVALAVAAHVSVDSRMMETFQEGDEVWVTTTLLQDELDGVLPLEVSFSSDRHNRFEEPDVINAMHDLGVWSAEYEDVLSTTSYADFLDEARAVYRDDQTLRGQPFRSVAEVSALASLLESGNPNPIAPYVTLDRRRARLSIKINDIGISATRDLVAAIRVKVDELFGDLDDVDVVLTGNAFVASEGISALVNDMLKSLSTAFVIIFLIMTVLFRSVRVGLMSIPPNIIPLVLTMAYMTIAGINLNTATVVTFAVSLGLAVDHTIHMMARFLEEVRGGATLDQALVASVRGTGRAIVVTSITLFAGMIVLFFTSFVPIRHFATLLGVTALSCLLGNLLILPALMKVGWRKATDG